jgi:hypothetical protein
VGGVGFWVFHLPQEQLHVVGNVHTSKFVRGDTDR